MTKILIFYKVLWIDSQTDTGWQEISSIEPPSKLTESYGFFIKQGKKFTTYAADMDPDTVSFNRFIHIPNENIRKKEIIFKVKGEF